MAIYFKTIVGGIVNCDFIESIYLTTSFREKDYEIRALATGNDSSTYLLYHTKDKKDAEDKLNEIVNILEENGNKIFDLAPTGESEDNEQTVD